MFLLLISLAITLVATTSRGSSAAQSGFGDTAFAPIWERTDAPVLSGRVERSWYWGPEPGKQLKEPYSGSSTGTRLVQYFDKARMEVNNPQGDRASEWFVTTGLLVVDMVSGKQQVGDREFVALRAAEMAVGGDGLHVDPDAPSYTSFRHVASVSGSAPNRAPNRVGETVAATINRAGQIGSNPANGIYPGAKIAAYSEVLGHNIPQAMWDFLNLKGPVQQGGRVVEGQTIANWVFVMGYPITEAYWARIRIEGVFYDALFQMYERRSLAYIPAFPKGWQVQMGNVGQHYYKWLYGGALPSPVVPIGATQPVPVPPLPSSASGDITPNAAVVGTPLSARISGFTPGEGIVSWFTDPDRTARDARINLVAGQDRTASAIVLTAGLAPGVWAITFRGRQSGHEAILYFFLYELPSTATPPRVQTATSTLSPQATGTPITSPTRTPTPPRGSVTATATVPPVPTEPPAGLILTVRPGFGPPDGEFVFSARGLAPGENIQVTFTDPNGTRLYPFGGNGRYTADATGAWSLTLVPSTAFPSPPLGNWIFALRGEGSGQEGIIGFTLR